MDVKAGKAKSGRGGKSASRPVAAKVKRQFSLSADADRRICVHAVAYGETPSDLVERLVVEHLREFFLQRQGGSKPGPADSGEAPSGAGEGGRDLPGAGSAG